MTAEELLTLLENPALITAEVQDELESLADEYPYFSTARLLLLKGLRATDTELFDNRLATLSAYAPSRKQLYHYLNATSGFDNSTNSLHRSTQPTSADNHQDEKSSNENHLKHQELIDNFILNDPQITPLRAEEGTEHISISIETTSTKAPTLPTQQGKTPQDADLSDEFFSEKLAYIYIKQRKYEKAIKIFNRLSLEYPEKSSYFADQIRFFRIIIDNYK